MKLSAFKIFASCFLCSGLWFIINRYVFLDLKLGLNTAQFELLIAIIPYGIILILGLLLFKWISLNNHTFKSNDNDYLNFYLSNPNPLWVFDPVSFRFLSVNDAAVANYGYTREEFLTMTIKDIRPPEDVAKIIDFSKRITEDQFSSGIWRHLKKDGNIIYVKITSIKITFNKKTAVMILAADTTEQVIYEQKLQQVNQVLLEEKQKLKETEKLAKVSGWEYFVENDSLIWSDELYEIFEVGRESEQVDYDMVLKSVHPDDLPRYIQAVENLLKNGKDLDVNHRFITKTGNTKYVNVLAKMQYLDGKMYKVHGTMQDVTELKLIQQEKNTYQQRLKSTLKNITNGYFMLNRSWIITDVNNNCENILMVKKEQMLNRNYLTIFPRAKNLKFYTYFKKVLDEGVPVNFEEYDIYLKKWFCVNAYPTDEGVAVYFEDTTENKKKDLQLKEAVERYDLVAKATNDVVYDFNILNNHIRFSSSMADLLGETPDEIGSDLEWWKSKIHPEDLNRAETKYQNVVNKKQTHFEQEYRMKTSSGQYKYVFDQSYLQYDEQGNYIRLIGAIKDINQLKQFDAENKRLADIITKVNNMIVIQDKNHKIIWVNKAFENATGYTLCEVAGKHSHFLQGPETDVNTLTAIAADKRSYKKCSYDIINYTKNQKKYWVNIEFTPLFTAKKEPDGYISIYNDITIRKEKEEKVTRQNEILKNIAWMSSHELRRPVASILGLIELINETTAKEDKDEPIRMLQTCTQQLDEIIHKINHRIEQEIAED